MAPEDKASNLQPPTWSGEALKGPGSPTVSKHVLLAHQLQAEQPKSEASATRPQDCSAAAQDKAEGQSKDSNCTVTTPPPPPPLLSLQPPDVASLLPIPGLQPFRETSTGHGRRSSGSDSEDEDESTLSKKELRMRRNRESAARSRKRKRDEVEALTIRVDKLTEENTEHKRIIESLRKIISEYRERFGSLEEGKA